MNERAAEERISTKRATRGRRHHRLRRREGAENARRETDAKVAQILSTLPSSKEEYLARMALLFRGAVNLTRCGLVGKGSPLAQMMDNRVDGYRVDADSLAAFDDAIEEVIAAITSARAISDKASRDAAVTTVRSAGAKKDVEFLGFMEAIVPPQSQTASD